MSVYSFRGIRPTRRWTIELLMLVAVVGVSAWLLATTATTTPEPVSHRTMESTKVAGPPAIHRRFEAPREKAIRRYAESYGLSIEDVRRAVYRLDYEIPD